MQQSLDEYQVLEDMQVPKDYRSAGFIYVLSNEHMPGVYKIGMTKNDPESRAKEISSTTGVPSPFNVVAAFHSMNPRADERMIHDAFASCRVSQNREFFSLPNQKDIDDALCELESVIGPERNAMVSDLAMSDVFISFSNEAEIDLSEELFEQGIGGVSGNIAAVKNFIINAGIRHVKDLINRHHASIVINPDRSVVLVKSVEQRWMEEQYDQQCSEG